MAAPHIDPAAVLPRSEWETTLRQTTVEVFSIMVGVTVTTPEEVTPPVQGQMTGVVGIAGAVRATFSLRCSPQSAIKLASQMLGVAPDDPDAQKAAADAVGEICNVVAGHFKAKIGLGEKCMLSLPAILTGRDYRIHFGAAVERMEFPLLFESEPVWITLDIRP